jgi:tetratricopeptide (TPR) repeat protein
MKDPSPGFCGNPGFFSGKSMMVVRASGKLLELFVGDENITRLKRRRNVLGNKGHSVGLQATIRGIFASSHGASMSRVISFSNDKLSPEAANIQPEKPISTAAYEDYLRGIDLYSLNQFAAAIEMLEKSTTIEPNYGPVGAPGESIHHPRAAWIWRPEYIKAQAAYEKAIALNPSLVEPRIYMANLFTDTGRVDQAVPLLRSVLPDSPNNVEARELDYVYRFAGMLEESVRECEQAR